MTNPDCSCAQGPQWHLQNKVKNLETCEFSIRRLRRFAVHCLTHLFVVNTNWSNSSSAKPSRFAQMFSTVNGIPDLLMAWHQSPTSHEICPWFSKIVMPVDIISCFTLNVRTTSVLIFWIRSQFHFYLLFHQKRTALVLKVI